MKRHLSILGLLVACAGLSQGQQPASEAPPLSLRSYVPTHLLYTAPVPGIPFSATIVVQNEHTLPDGSVERMGTINVIGRDSRGRTHGEQRMVISEPFQSEPLLVQVIIFDPSTSQRTTYDIHSHTALRFTSREPRGGPEAPNPQIKFEDLGYSNVVGLDARGTRRTFTIPADRSGTGAPLAVVDEYWYSEELHLNVLTRHIDPRNGVKTFTLTNLNREEPPEVFFEPQGFRILDRTSSAGTQ